MYGFYFIFYHYYNCYFRRQRRRSGVFIVNFKHISHIVMVFP